MMIGLWLAVIYQSLSLIRRRRHFNLIIEFFVEIILLMNRINLVNMARQS